MHFFILVIFVLLGLFVCLFACFEIVGRELGGYRGRENTGGIGGGEKYDQNKVYTENLSNIFLKGKRVSMTDYSVPVEFLAA